VADPNDADQPDPEYAVGYKRPPKHAQFQKGRSGNSRGRPKGAGSLRTIVQDQMMKKVRITAGGETLDVPIAQAIVMRVLRDAAGGNRKASEQGLRMIERYAPLESDEPVVFDLTDFSTDEKKELLRLLDKCGASLNGPERTGGANG